jgi:hypothetical protein
MPWQGVHEETTNFLRFSLGRKSFVYANIAGVGLKSSADWRVNFATFAKKQAILRDCGWRNSEAECKNFKKEETQLFAGRACTEGVNYVLTLGKAIGGRSTIDLVYRVAIGDCGRCQEIRSGL